MNLEFKVYEALCETQTFRINGVDAEWEDFGTKFDASPDTAEDYGCRDMRFTRRDSTPRVLEKYGINETKYAEVCEKLEEGLSFGCCGWCS